MYKFMKTIFIFISLVWFQACVGEQGIFTNVSEVNLDNIPNRSDLRISDLAFDSTGRMYVCSIQGQVFSVFKRTVKEIKPSVIDESTPWMPRAIGTDQSDKLYVAGLNHVWIFDNLGEYVGGFETDILFPTSIAVASDSMIYLAGHKGEYVLHQYGKNGEEKPALEAFKESSDVKNSGGTFVFQRKGMGSVQIQRSSDEKNDGEKPIIKKVIKSPSEKSGEEKPALEAFKESSDGKNSGGTFVFQRKGMGSLQIQRSSDEKNDGEKPVIKKVIKSSSEKSGEEKPAPKIGSGTQDKMLMRANPSGGEVVRTWKNGVVFAKTPYHLLAYQNGQVVASHQRPELNFEPGYSINRSSKVTRIRIQDTGKKIGVTVTDEFVFYCYSLPGSDIYLDIYDHNLNLVEIDVGIDGTLMGADKEGYLYLKRKVDGREALFRAKFNLESLRKSQ